MKYMTTAVKSEGKRKQSGVTSEELPKPIIHKMLIDFSDREQANFCNSCMISPLQIPLQSAAWILRMDGSTLPATGTERNVMGRSRQIVSMAFSLGSMLPTARCLSLLFKAETCTLNSKPDKSLHIVAGLLKPRDACQVSQPCLHQSLAVPYHIFYRVWFRLLLLGTFKTTLLAQLDMGRGSALQVISYFHLCCRMY